MVVTILFELWHNRGDRCIPAIVARHVPQTRSNPVQQLGELYTPTRVQLVRVVPQPPDLTLTDLDDVLEGRVELLDEKFFDRLRRVRESLPIRPVESDRRVYRVEPSEGWVHQEPPDIAGHPLLSKVLLSSPDFLSGRHAVWHFYLLPLSLEWLESGSALGRGDLLLHDDSAESTKASHRFVGDMAIWPLLDHDPREGSAVSVPPSDYAEELPQRHWHDLPLLKGQAGLPTELFMTYFLSICKHRQYKKPIFRWTNCMVGDEGFEPPTLSV